jgi:glycosyltransferase involved in cell wall biosynthesis
MLEPAPPAPNAVGALDGAPGDHALLRGPTTISGWALFPGAATARVDVWLGEHRLGAARLCAPRPDVRDVTGAERGAVAGFELTVDLWAWPGADGESELRAVAVGTSGRRLELRRPVTVSAAPPPPFDAASGDLGGDRANGATRHGLNLLVATHRLDLGGAQIYLLDLLGELTRTGVAAATVIAAGDGETRGQLEALGVPVHLLGEIPVDSVDRFAERVEEIAAWAEPQRFDAVLVNTAVPLAFSGWGVAERLGIPAVWTIHESLEPSLLWAGVSPALRRSAEAALADAALAIFQAEGTERLFARSVPDGRRVAIPYGIDQQAIAAGRAAAEPRAAREAAGIPASADVVLCVGRIEPRKAQVPLVQAFGLVAARHPRARLVFVGATDEPESQLLREEVERCEARDRIDVVPLTADPGDWYAAGDLLVCASDNESLPRTVLEAMLWEKPVLATRIFGLPEVIDDGVTGWLCEPRDVSALAAGLDRALGSSPSERAKIARVARALIERRHALDRYGAVIAGHLDRVVAEHESLGRVVESA